MIFVTLGTQLPFERLIQAMDTWAEQHSSIHVFAQVGQTKYPVKFMQTVAGLSPKEYQDTFDRASLVVSHVGMGTIIAGLSTGKPMVLMPRQAALGEHRNDHQLATAKKFEKFEMIDIAHEVDQLFIFLNKQLEQNKRYQRESLSVSPNLHDRLTSFLTEVKKRV